MNDQVIAVVLIGIAFLAAVGVVAGFGLGVHIEPYIRRYASASLPILLLLGFSVATLLSGRDASLYGLPGRTLDAANGSGTWILRFFTLTAVGISLLLVSSSLLTSSKRSTEAKVLFVSFCTYFISTYVVSGLFGSVPDLTYKSLYPLLIISAIYFTSQVEKDLPIRMMRDGLFVFLVVGLLFILIKPELVLQRNYAGVLPFLKIRYWGLSSHANNVSPLAIFFALLLVLVPYRSMILRLAAFIAIIATLILAQSKTGFIALLLVVLAAVLRFLYYALIRGAYGKNVSVSIVLFLMVVVLAVLAVIVSGFADRPVIYISDLVFDRDTVLTGREYIWSITISEWKNNLAFGYGPGLWSDEHSAKYGYLGVASNAHNQFIDSLGVGGLVGLFGLIVYFSALGYFSFKLAGRTKMVSIALFLFFATRCITEVPLKTMNVMTSDFFMHCGLLLIYMRYLGEDFLLRDASPQVRKSDGFGIMRSS